MYQKYTIKPPEPRDRKECGTMHIEDRLELLESENRKLKEKVDHLELYSTTRFVTARELASLMGCTVQNVHRKIKTGEIRATRKLGDPRIPMCQFLEGLDLPDPGTREPEEGSMAEQIFGKPAKKGGKNNA